MARVKQSTYGGQIGSFVITTEIDMTPILAMVSTFENGMAQAYQLAKQRIQVTIRNEVLDTFVRNICAAAGPGWPEVYTDHLVAALKVNVANSTFGSNSDRNMFLLYNFEELGDYKDFEAGAHYQALLAAGGEENHPAGSSGSGHHGINPHPARVRLPYKGQQLLNEDDARRQEFWERVVIDRDFGYELLMRKGKGNWTIGEHMEKFGYDIATFDEVAAERVLAWGPKAPEWLLLENGSDSLMHGSRPVVRPTHFMTLVATAMGCVMEHIYTGAVETLVELAENAGAAVGSSGIPYARTSGRFTSYKELLDIKVGDYTPCFGRI